MPFGTGAPGLGISRFLRNVSEIAECFRGRTEFDIVIRRRRRGAEQPKLHFPHEVRYDCPPDAVKVLQNATLVAYHPSEVVRVEVVKLFIVRDCDAPTRL